MLGAAVLVGGARSWRHTPEAGCGERCVVRQGFAQQARGLVAVAAVCLVLCCCSFCSRQWVGGRALTPELELGERCVCLQRAAERLCSLVLQHAVCLASLLFFLRLRWCHSSWTKPSSSSVVTAVLAQSVSPSVRTCTAPSVVSAQPARKVLGHVVVQPLFVGGAHLAARACRAAPEPSASRSHRACMDGWRCGPVATRYTAARRQLAQAWLLRL